MATAILNAARPSGQLVSIGQAARLANVNPQTLRRYLESGLISGVVTPGGHRRLNLTSVADAFGVALPETEATDESTGRVVVAYARVSTQKQKAEGNLDRQVERLKAYCAENYAGQALRIIAEVGSGLSDHRQGFLRLVELLAAGRVATLVCEYRDTIARFGVGVVQRLCEAHQTQFVESKTADEAEHVLSAEAEMAKDVAGHPRGLQQPGDGKARGREDKDCGPGGAEGKGLSVRGAGLSRRAIVVEISKANYHCENTGKPIGEWFIRRVLDGLAGESTAVPSSVRTFLHPSVRSGQRSGYQARICTRPTWPTAKASR